MQNYTYPQAPVDILEDITKPSMTFRAQVSKVAGMVLLFAVVYFVLLLAGIALAIFCSYIGLMLIALKPSLWTILIGVGVAGLGLMVFYFLVKFMLVPKKNENQSEEIFEEDYPQLFEFIRSVSEETATRFPKKIFINSEVNAYVSYDSNFWSMFIPVRKNLTIGLGLVNMVNMSEFKSILAHEFGHFSQKSMKAGSFVYQSNKVIYNMLYDNDSYVDALNRWGSLHSIFSFAAQLTVGVVKFIQWVLREVYKMVNKSYMALSREMEFNADAMSVKVAGGNNAISALRRVEIASICYDTVIEKYNELYEKKYIAENVFSHQRIVGRLIAETNNLALSNDLPIANDKKGTDVNLRRITVKDQWSSHPTLEEREYAIDQYNVTAATVDESPWILFNNAKELQESVTNNLYHSVSEIKDSHILDDTAFINKMQEDKRENSFPEVYKGYYDHRRINKFEISGIDDGAPLTDIDTFYKEHVELRKRMQALIEDIQLLEAIAQKDSDIRTFDYNGEKYNRNAAKELSEEFTVEYEEMNKRFSESDRTVYLHYVFHSKGKDLQSLYKSYFDVVSIEEGTIDILNLVMEKMSPILNGQEMETNVAIDLAKSLIEERKMLKNRVEQVEEELFKTEFREDIIVPDEIKDSFHNTHQYFINNHFHDENLRYFITSIQRFADWSYLATFQAQKILLEKQVNLSSNTSAEQHLPYQ